MVASIFFPHEGEWHAPPENVELADDEVHVWRASLDLPTSRVESLWQTLGDDEQRRALRFYFKRDRTRFIVRRGLRRAILGCYLARSPASLCFCYNTYGKPALDVSYELEPLSFNVSYTNGLALYVIARNRAIGVDIEYIRKDIEYEAIAEYFFSPAERSVLQALPITLRQTAFFTFWTRKEAYVKAHGEGLSLPLDQFDVTLDPGETGKLPNVNNNPNEAARWSLCDLSPGHGCIAALVVEGCGWRLACWQWPE
jgi:4'-phosphopantetheinyl transferase